MAKVVVVDLIQNYTSYCTGETGKLWKSSESVGTEGIEFRIPSQYNRGAKFVFNYWDANCVGREVMNGDVAQRSKADFSAQATVISAVPFPQPPVIDLAIGDYLVDPKLDLIVQVTDGGRWADPGAKIITEQAATEDHSELVAAENARPKRYVSESYLSG